MTSPLKLQCEVKLSGQGTLFTVVWFKPGCSDCSQGMGTVFSSVKHALNIVDAELLNNEAIKFQILCQKKCTDSLDEGIFISF